MNTRLENVLHGFTTMGCPEASLREARALAAEYALEFIELRALGGTVDLPGYFAREEISDDRTARPPVRLVATGLRLIDAEEKDVETFLRYVEVADRLGAPYVRVFGGGEWGDALSSGQWDHAAGVATQCRAGMEARGSHCELLLETHSAFCSSAMCLRLNERMVHPVRLLWDAHHTWRSAGESPADTWRQIGHLVRHMHFSDSRLRPPPQKGYDCVLPGTGEYPVEALRDVLAENRCDFGISLEWEKIWHPELPDIRQALDIFAQQF